MTPSWQAMIPPGKIDSARFQARDDPGRLLSFPLYHSRSCQPPTEHEVSSGLSDGLSTIFPLHKGVPSLLNNPSTTSPYQCRFLSNKHQVVTHYLSSSCSRSPLFRVIINILGKLPIFFKESSFSLLSLQSISLNIFVR
jgi:hypothetical protein